MYSNNISTSKNKREFKEIPTKDSSTLNLDIDEKLNRTKDTYYFNKYSNNYMETKSGISQIQTAYDSRLNTLYENENTKIPEKIIPEISKNSAISQLKEIKEDMKKYQDFYLDYVSVVNNSTPEFKDDKNEKKNFNFKYNIIDDKKIHENNEEFNFQNLKSLVGKIVRKIDQNPDYLSIIGSDNEKEPSSYECKELNNNICLTNNFKNNEIKFDEPEKFELISNLPFESKQIFFFYFHVLRKNN